MKPFLAFAVVAMAAVGCSKDFLQTTPVGRDLEVNYYQTEEQALEALVSVYDVLQWNDQYGFSMYRFLMTVLLTIPTQVVLMLQISLLG